MIQSSRVHALKGRYRFDQWRHASEGRERLFVRYFKPPWNELLERRLVRIRAAALGGERLLSSSTWQCPDTLAEPPVVVDTFEHRSRLRAHESLIELAGEFHLPVVLDFELEEVGDVRLATADGTWFAFARGNVLVRVMSGDGKPASAHAIAERFDEALTSRPLGAAEADGPSDDVPTDRLILHPGTARFCLEELAQTSGAAPGEQPLVKVFSRGADVEFDGDYVLVPEAPEVEIEVFVIDPKGISTYKRYRGSVPQWSNRAD